MSAAEWTPPSFGTPVWFDIPAVDVVGLKKFYSSLFPSWTWKPATEQHTEQKIAMFTFGTDAGALSGGITQVEPEAKKNSLSVGVGVTIYCLVGSIDETRSKVIELGGTIVKEKTKEGESGHYMFFHDLEGNRFGVYQFGGS